MSISVGRDEIIDNYRDELTDAEIYEGANNIQRVVAFRQLLRTLSRKGLISPEVVRAIT